MKSSLHDRKKVVEEILSADLIGMTKLVDLPLAALSAKFWILDKQSKNEKVHKRRKRK